MQLQTTQVTYYHVKRKLSHFDAHFILKKIKDLTKLTQN
jgi:hypothetical protein